jgi:hypothetical protein
VRNLVIGHNSLGSNENEGAEKKERDMLKIRELVVGPILGDARQT